MDALDKYVFAPVCHPVFDIAVKHENQAGDKIGRDVRVLNSTPGVSTCFAPLIFSYLYSTGIPFLLARYWYF